jgi:large subunit ribosomal protein L24
MRRPKSSKARKQRKFLFTAPLHLRRKFLAAHLSKELREKYKRRSLPVRKGDEVEIMRGEFKGKKGKISRVDLKNYKVYIEGITRRKTTGAEAQVPIYPSNLRIISLNLDDKKRVEAIERKIKKGEHGKA